jgi:Zn-dependent protease with chaperone function
MNFRKQQQLAKRNSQILIAYFAFSVFMVVFSVWYFTAIVFAPFTLHAITINPVKLLVEMPFYSAFTIFALVAMIAFGASNMAQTLKGDGNAVAKMLGARAASPNRPIEKRLLNVVEEIALSSGILPPSVYLLNDDEAINALAAGENQQKAAIVVTSGALRYLSRDELQAVIAHEFSHIYNNDIKLNMQAACLLAGVALVGRNGGALINEIANEDARVLDGSLKPSVTPFAFISAIVGMPLHAYGLLGAVFASLAKSALNQEREFLADASAVQFTRQIDGITSALKKIGGLKSTVESASAPVFSHFFFAQGAAETFNSHPPLQQRIKRLEPKWDGQFIVPRAISESDDEFDDRSGASAKPAELSRQTLEELANVALFDNGAANAIAQTPTVAEAATFTPIALKGAKQNSADFPHGLTPELIARHDMDAIEPFLHECAADALSARWIIYALLIDRVDRAVASRQHKIVATRVYPDEFEKIIIAINSLKRESVVHLIFLCVPALKNLTIDQYKHFREVADLLIEEDGKVSLFEFNLKYLVFYPLDIAFDLRKSPKIVYNAIEPIAKEISVALSAIVYDQYQNDDKAKVAFDNVCKTINALEYVPANKILTQMLERAYDRIQQSNDEIKRQIIDLAIESVKSDGVISHEEAETIHALRSALGLGYM